MAFAGGEAENRWSKSTPYLFQGRRACLPLEGLAGWTRHQQTLKRERKGFNDKAKGLDGLPVFYLDSQKR